MSISYLNQALRDCRRPRPTRPATVSRILPRMNCGDTDWTSCRKWLRAGERMCIRIPDEPLTLFVADFWKAEDGVHVVASVWPEARRSPGVFNCSPGGIINAFAYASFVATPIAITHDQRLLLSFETPADTIEVSRHG